MSITIRTFGLNHEQLIHIPWDTLAKPCNEKLTKVHAPINRTALVQRLERLGCGRLEGWKAGRTGVVKMRTLRGIIN